MIKKKKVLIISNRYLQSNHIGSIRPRKIAKYLTATGKYDISIITAVDQSAVAGQYQRYSVNLSIVEEDQYINDYTLVSYPNSVTKMVSIWGKLHFSKKRGNVGATSKQEVNKFGEKFTSNKITRFLSYTQKLVDDLLFYRRTKREVRKNKSWDTEVVFSTYPTFSCHYLARYIKKKNPNVFWVADFRDQVYDYTVPKLFKSYAKNFTMKICKSADAITAVSQGVIDNILLPDVPAYIITNGFDQDDVPREKKNCKNEKFVLAYTGRIKNKQNLSVLFQALRELIDEGVLDDSRIQIDFAGSGEGNIRKQVEFFKLQHILHSYGFVDRNEALKIQRNSSILLVASWNVEGFTGMLTGKLLEYMMMEKPVITIVVGELPNSIIKEVTDQCSLGFCYEETSKKNDYALLKEYIKTQYSHFIEKGSVSFEPNYEEINKYNYANIVEKLERLFGRYL